MSHPEEGAPSLQGELPLPGGKLRRAQEMFVPPKFLNPDATHAEFNTMPPALALQEEFGWRTVFGVWNQFAAQPCGPRGSSAWRRHTLSAPAEANPNTPVFTTQTLCCVASRLLCYLGKDLLIPAPLTCSYLKMRNHFIQ